MNAKTPSRQDAKGGVWGVARWVCLWGVVVVLGGEGFAGAAEAALPGEVEGEVPGEVEGEEAEIDAALMAELEGLDAKAAGVEDYEAGFEQRRYTPLLKKAMVSRGRVRAVAGVSRWDTEAPYASVMRITAGRLEVYYPEQKVLEVYPVERRLGELAASPIPRLSVWVEHFVIERAGAADLPEGLRGLVEGDSTLTVRLTPRDEALAEQVGVILVVIDGGTGLSRAMVWTGAEEGERTEMVFGEARVNTGLEAGDLAIEVAEGAEVVYPLGAVKE